MHLRYSNSAINSEKVRLLIRAGSDLSKLSPRFYYEIEQEVLPSIIEDRLLVAKVLHARK